MIRWRCHPDSDRGIKVLQTFALPLGYGTEVWSGRRDSDPRHPPWQGGTLPLSYYRVAKIKRKWSGRRDSDPRHPPWQGGTLPLSYYRMVKYEENGVENGAGEET